MNRLLMLSGLLVLAGCATGTASLRDTAARTGPAAAYIKAVEQAAGRRGVMVQWVPRPTDEEVGQLARR